MLPAMALYPLARLWPAALTAEGVSIVITAVAGLIVALTGLIAAIGALYHSYQTRKIAAPAVAAASDLADAAAAKRSGVDPASTP